AESPGEPDQSGGGEVGDQPGRGERRDAQLRDTRHEKRIEKRPERVARQLALQDQLGLGHGTVPPRGAGLLPPVKTLAEDGEGGEQNERRQCGPGHLTGAQGAWQLEGRSREQQRVPTERRRPSPPKEEGLPRVRAEERARSPAAPGARSPRAAAR